MSIKKVVGGIVIGMAVLSLVAVFWARGAGSGGKSGTLYSGGGDIVGILEIDGVIAGGYSSSGLFGGGMTGSQTVMDQLRDVGANPGIKAVVIRINSPGGTPAAAQEITDEIIRLKASGIKIVTSMGDTAASGAYWIASASDSIVANPGTLTGSIGVIMQAQNYRGLMDKLGIYPNTIKSGEYKDMGSPDRPMSAEERELFQSMVDDTYNQFVDTVARGRGGKISPDAIRALNGRVLTGQQALNAGLVDKTGNLYDAISLAGEMSGLGKKPRTVYIGPKNQWWSFLNDNGGTAGTRSPGLDSIENYGGALLIMPLLLR